MSETTVTLDAVIKATPTETFTLDAIISTDTRESVAVAQFVPTKYLRGRNRI